MQTANVASCSKLICTHNWDLPTPLQTYTHHRGIINCIVWNHTNKALASCGIDGKIILVSTQRPDTIAFDVQFDLTKVVSVNSCAFSSNSRYIAAGGSDSLVKIWDMKSSKKEVPLVLRSHFGAVTSVAWSRADDVLASSSVIGDVVLNSVSNGNIVQSFSTNGKEEVSMIRFSQGSTHNRIGGCTNNGSVIVWDITTRLPLCSFPKEHRAEATALSFSSFNPVLLVSASMDQDLNFFDISDKRKVKTITAEQSLTSVSFHSDGHTLIAGGMYGGLYVYDLRKPNTPKDRLIGHDSAVRYVDFLKEKEPVPAKFTSVLSPNNPNTAITSTNPIQTKKQTPLSTMPVLIQKPVQRIIERPRPASKVQTSQPIISNISVTPTPTQLPPPQPPQHRSTSINNYMQPLIPQTQQTRSLQPSLPPPPQQQQSNPSNLNPSNPFITKDSFNDFSQRLRGQISQSFELMHLEIIRQFQIQQKEFKNIIEDMLREDRRKDTYIRELEQENQKLKKISY